MNPIELKLFSSRLQALCDEMGGVLRRSAFSPNIKDRLDFSCALFGADGRLAAQAAHIPVHLGSMAYTMEALVASRDWRPGDAVVVNDPYLGGTHLPDVTLVAPVFITVGGNTQRVGFVANRAHHANIGCETPGSMPLSEHIDEEGVLIPPTLLRERGCDGREQLNSCGVGIDALLFTEPGKLSGDFAAQLGANDLAVARLESLVKDYGTANYQKALEGLNAYARRLARSAFKELADGEYRGFDELDDDGFGSQTIGLHVRITTSASGWVFDFSESSDQVRGNLNCPEAVAAAAVYYCHCCLLPAGAPLCAGLFEDLTVITRRGSIVNPLPPAAVAAGNVETSTRLVDLLFRALAPALPGKIPAASQGSMNNVALGALGADGKRWDYYETLAGGIGAGPTGAGRAALHSHMTNTLNTPVESLEYHYPLRLTRYAIRQGSGGAGAHAGGNGLTREYEFLAPAQLSLLTERRRIAPWGLMGGVDGATGCNSLNNNPLPSKGIFDVEAGDKLLVETPGGGGWGYRS